jgi:hypothetical protein
MFSHTFSDKQFIWLIVDKQFSWFYDHALVGLSLPFQVLWLLDHRRVKLNLSPWTLNFGVHSVTIFKILVFSGVTSCGLVNGFQRFGETCSPIFTFKSFVYQSTDFIYQRAVIRSLVVLENLLNYNLCLISTSFQVTPLKILVYSPHSM